MNKKIFLACCIVFSLITFAAASGQSIDYDYENPIGFNSLTGFIEHILVTIQNLVGWLAVIFIIIGGVIYITGGGSEKQVSVAKSIITNALIGFALVVAAPSLLKELKDIIMEGETDEGIIEDANTIEDILLNVLDFALTAIGVLALLSFVISGIIYLSSTGDKGKVEKAKKTVIYSIIAVAVAGSGLILVNQIIAFLEATA
ncbi:MAG: hypothetical protein R6V40_03140 [Candidatus Moraniibacteriota bacterium]